MCFRWTHKRFPTWKMHAWACPRCNSMCLRAQQAVMSAITTSRTSLLTSTNRSRIMKSSEEKAKRSARRTATTCDRSGTTSKTLRTYFCAQCHVEGAEPTADYQYNADTYRIPCTRGLTAPTPLKHSLLNVAWCSVTSTSLKAFSMGTQTESYNFSS